MKIGWIRKWIGPLWINEEDEELARTSHDENTQRRLDSIRGRRRPRGSDDEGVIHQDPSSDVDAAQASESGEEAIPLPPPADPSGPNLVDEVESTRRAAVMADLLEHNPQIRSAIERIAQDSRNWPTSEEELEETARLISPYIPKGLNPSQVSAIIREEINRKPTMTAEELAQAVKLEMNNRQPEIRDSVLKAIRQDRPQPIPPAQAARTSRPRRSALVTQQKSPPAETPRGDDGSYRLMALVLGVILVIIVAAGGAGMWISNTINDSVNRSVAAQLGNGSTPAPTQSATPAAPVATPPAAPNPTAPAAVLPPVVGNGGNTGSCVAGPALAIHNQFLKDLRPYWNDNGSTWQEWLKQAGFQWDVLKDEVNPQEDPVLPDGNQYISGLQITGTNVQVNWPNVVTTNDPSRITKNADSREYNAAPSNTQSTLYTNVIANGHVTVYASGYSWGQLSQYFPCSSPLKTKANGGNSYMAPVGGSSASTVSGSTNGSANGAAGTSNCLTKSQLQSLGSIIVWLQDSNGAIQGAQLRLNQKIIALPGSSLQRNVQVVESANKGDVVSYWLSPSCEDVLKGGGSATTFRIGA